MPPRVNLSKGKAVAKAAFEAAKKGAKKLKAEKKEILGEGVMGRIASGLTIYESGTKYLEERRKRRNRKSGTQSGSDSGNDSGGVVSAGAESGGAVSGGGVESGNAESGDAESSENAKSGRDAESGMVMQREVIKNFMGGSTGQQVSIVVWV